MKLSKAFTLLTDLRLAVQVAFLPTLRTVLKTPMILMHPVALSRLFMSHVWSEFGNGIDENTNELKTGFITPNAVGVVLEIGAGHGHTAKYLDRTKVTKYVAVEPNEHMHKEIRRIANGAGFTEDNGTLRIIPHGAEDVGLLTSALGGMNNADTIISILSLCTVPAPQDTIRVLVEQILRPGGCFLFYEHVQSHREDVAWWQRFWTPVWKLAFDGCCLDRPTDRWLENLDVWESKDLWCKKGEEEEHLFWHRGGKLVKEA